MPGLPNSRSSAGAKPRNSTRVRPGRKGLIGLIVFSVLILIGGIEALAVGIIRLQDAGQLSSAPVCTSAQQVGCRLDERVTVLDRHTEYFGRGGVAQIVKVQTPDGSTKIVYATDHDSGLWSRLYVNEVLNAELWNDSVIRLDDNSGHFVIADDSPAVTSILFPVIGTLSVLAGGGLLVFSLRAMSRQRHNSR